MQRGKRPSLLMPATSCQPNPNPVPLAFPRTPFSNGFSGLLPNGYSPVLESQASILWWKGQVAELKSRRRPTGLLRHILALKSSPMPSPTTTPTTDASSWNAASARCNATSPRPASPGVKASPRGNAASPRLNVSSPRWNSVSRGSTGRRTSFSGQPIKPHPCVGIGASVQKCTNGVQVLKVTADGPSSAQCLQPGDVIRSINGFAVMTAEHVAFLSSGEPGTRLRVQLLRESKPLEVEVMLRVLPNPVP
mmetsp:Transcript_11400/g.25933  ORF Transcript_11400/g.25933 Transcript_11400/m.25933 type:complete len:250 (+) Transcript_11400:56-805(+)